jgi:ATP-binding cassette subfamily C protein/ATP-binding cassette subfamily C protein EexD
MNLETEIGRALRACRGTAARLVGISAALNLLALASPLYAMQLYDRVLASRSVETLLGLSVAVVFALGVLSLLDGLRQQILARVGLWLDDRLAPPLIAAWIQASPDRAGLAHAQPLRDLAALRGFLASPAVIPLLDAPWAPLFLGMLFVLHPLLGFFGLGAALLLLGTAALSEFATRALLREGSIAALKSNALLDAAGRSADAIRVMGMLGGLLRIWRDEAAPARQTHHVATHRGAAILALSRFIRLTVQSGIMGVAAWLVIDDQATPGVLFASTFLLARALAPLENAISTSRSLIGTRLAYRRLVAVLASAPALATRMPLPRPRGVVTLEQVSYVPPGSDRPIVAGASMQFGPGEILGIVGASGAGKSTLAGLIAGAAEPTSGSIRLDGTPLAHWLAAGGSAHIGFLPQDVELFCGSVRDNIARLGSASAAQVLEAASLVDLHDMVVRLPQGYDTPLGEGGIKLSGGQRQRIALARAVFGDPRLVVLDEPDANLDHVGETALGHALEQLRKKGATVLVVSHRLAVLKHVDKLAVMRQGAVELFGARDEVIAKLRPVELQPARPVAVRSLTSA